MIKIKRFSKFLRTCGLTLKNKDFELNKILFYENNKIVFENNSGWLEHFDLKFKHGQDIQEFYLNNVKRAIKLNLNGTDNFIIKSKNKYKSSTYDLYINMKNIKVLNKIEILDYETLTQKHFKTICEIEFKNVRKELINYDKLTDKATYKDIEHKTFNIIKERRTENKKEFEQVEQLKKEFDKLKIIITSFDLEEIFKNFDIKRKVLK